MDSAYKQRLIGAAVLVAAAIIILPMLIGRPDDRAAMPSTTVPLDIPQAPDRRFETRELSPVTPAPIAQTAPAADEGTVATVDITSSTGREVGVDPDEGFDLASRPAPAAVTTAKPETPPSSAPTPKPTTAPTPVQSATPPATVVAPATYTSGYAVNLGSYANAANANALVSQLKARDLPAYAEPVSLDGKPAQRVRLGPYVQRGQAESARLTVSQLRRDIPAVVVALDGEPVSKAATPAKPAVASGFAVQLGAFKSEDDANQLRNRVRNAGFSAYVERANTEAGVLWRVRAGPETQRAGAERIRDQIKAKLNLDGNVVSHP